MEEEYVVIVMFENKAEADKLVIHLEEMASRSEIHASWGSAEKYKPFHYISDVIEIAFLKVKAFFGGL